MSLRALTRLLVEEREDVVPLIGAGLCLEAGLPDAASLAQQLADDAGLILANPCNFGAVCRAIEEAEGLQGLQERAAAPIAATPITPTPTLKALAGCPSRCILTTNYDTAPEEAVRAIGKRPKTLCLDEPWMRTTEEDEVLVVHLHGVVDRPETMILTTAQRGRLVSDEVFRTQLVALALGARVVAFGLRLSPEEAHLRTDFQWLATSMPAERRPIVVVTAGEADEGLTILADDGVIELHACDPGDDHLEVRQCAQVLSPLPVVATEVITRRAAGIPEPYCPTPLLGPRALAESSDPAIAAMFAGTRIGTLLSGLEELLAAGYVLLEAAPGRGKSATLSRLGEMAAGRSVRCDLRDLEPVQEDPARGLARLLVRGGQAFDGSTQVPNTQALAEGSYVFLLDGFDESSCEKQGQVVEAIEAATERWPQHTYVVATRPTSEVGRFAEIGFTTYRIEATETWGREYLAANGITPEQIEELYERVPTIGEHVAIPRYAALIANLMLQPGGEGVPEGALELLVLGERRNLESSANELVVELDELLEWARRLAVRLEFEGRSSAAVEEVAALPPPAGHSSPKAREDLVRSALLQDVPEQASFSAHVSQEALCAEAMLRSPDPLATLQEVAVAEVAGVSELRDDMDHTLDLFFEGAGLELRAELREIDPLRWARTQAPGGDPELVVEAIETICSFYREKRLWIQVHGEGLLRGSGEALKLLSRGAPGHFESMRAQFVAECNSPERTVRGNAVEILTLLPPDPENEELLSRLLGDADGVVRRHAAHAIEHFRLTGLVGRLFEAWAVETDELGFEAIGLAIAALADEEELFASLGSLREEQIGWRRVSHRFLARVPITALPELIDSAELRLDDGEEVLERRFAAEEAWSGDEVEALGRLLVWGGPRFFGHKHQGQVSRVAAEFPQEALAGARAGAGEETRDLDLLWLDGLPLETLRAEATGVLAEPLGRIVERREWQQQHLEEPVPAPAEEEAEGTGAVLSTQLSEGRIAENRVPSAELLWGLGSEPPEVREQIGELAEVWYSDYGRSGVRHEGNRVIFSSGLRSAAIVWAVLDRDPGEERCLELLDSGLGSLDTRFCEWLARHWRDDYSERAAAVVRGLYDPHAISAAAQAIPTWDGTLCDIFALKVPELGDHAAARTVISRMGENLAEPQLRSLANSEIISERRDQALNELAVLGDFDAQHTLLERILAALEENPHSFERDGPHWLGVVTSADLAELLGSILRAAHGASETSLLSRQVEAAIRNIADPRCIAVYDELIEAPDLRAPQFFWYQRQALVRHMVRLQVLARLEELGEAAIDALLFGARS